MGRFEHRGDAIEYLRREVKKGRTVVPLLGAGISVAAGVPSLREVSRYLAKVAYYLDHGVYRSQAPEESKDSDKDKDRAFRHQPQRYLREFGWPDPFEINSDLWYFLTRKSPQAKTQKRWELMDSAIEEQILSSLKRIDGGLVDQIEQASKGRLWHLSGSYWKLLLTQLTRSSPDLVDTLFQKLTHRRRPAVAHRFLAFLTPALRIRLFLTTNFDSLLEDALRLEGHRPVVYEVPDGLALPHHLLLQKELSVVKLHGGAYGLLVGDKLDTPLDEETRARFLSYLPDRLILLVMGLGGWDQRVLDMIELTHERNGEVLWLHFEPGDPPSLIERYRQDIPSWLLRHRVQDPGGFLRELYHAYKSSSPSSRGDFNSSDHRPVSFKPSVEPLTDTKGRPKENQVAALIRVSQALNREHDPRVIVFQDTPEDEEAPNKPGLGASGWLSRFVAAYSETHLPVWIDVETKSTVEDLLVDLIQQLRHYDPGLPPEILIVEQADSEEESSHNNLSEPGNGKNFRKVVARIYAALARGRYIVAFSGLRSFRRYPTRHDATDSAPNSKPTEETDHRRRFVALIEALLVQINGAKSQSGSPAESSTLGLLDSILAFALDQLPVDEDDWRRVFESHFEKWPPIHLSPEVELPDDWKEKKTMRFLTLLSTFRRRRGILGVRELGCRYYGLLQRGEEATEELKNSFKDCLNRTLDHGGLWLVEGGELWMSRALRNKIYGKTKALAERDGGPVPELREALLLLVSIHRDLADHHHQSYRSSHDIKTMLEGLYHRVALLRYLRRLALITEPEVSRGKPDETAAWILDLYKNPAKPLKSGQVLFLRLLELNTLAGILEEEQESLLERIPRVTLVQWAEAIEEETPIFGEMKPPCSKRDVEALTSAAQRLTDILSDLKVEALHHALQPEEIPVVRWPILSGLFEIPPEAAKALAKQLQEDEAAKILETQMQIIATGKFQKLGMPQGKEDFLRWRELYRTFRALEDTLLSIRSPGFKTPAGVDRDQVITILFTAAERLQADWSKKLGPQRHQETLYSDLEARFYLLQIYRKLSGLSPWARKGKGVGYANTHREKATTALDLGKKAVQVLDRTRESSKLPRSRLYNALGHAHLLLGNFDEAFLEFDRARAGLGEENVLEREVLAENLLHHAESLMAYSDWDLADWPKKILIDLPRESSEPLAWRRALSSEGKRKFAPGLGEKNKDIDDAQALSLLDLSLSNWDPDLVYLVEQAALAQQRSHEAHASWSVSDQFEIGKEQQSTNRKDLPRLADALLACRSRLAAAEDLLERVVDLLETSRRRIDLWSLYFHLKAQLSIELLLLILSGDVPAAASGSPPALVEADLRKLLEGWLRPEREGQDPELPLFASDAAMPRDLRSRFIHNYIRLLRQGLAAVRQGLDILLPGRGARKEEELKRNPLVRRHLRLWSELMVCGAYLTSMSLKTRPEQIQDDARRRAKANADIQRRWRQWKHLNQLAGLVHLPRCDEIKAWFLRQGDWDLKYPSGLGARARALARMEMCLAAKPKGETTKNLDPEGFDFADAVTSLCRALVEPSEVTQISPVKLALSRRRGHP